MIKLAKYLRPFALAVLLAIALLFGQAICELNLPNYMSDIVNVGIQQGGIANAAPEAVSAKGLSFMKNFMTDAQKKEVDQNYSLLHSVDSASHPNEVSRYPLLKSEDIYVRGNVSDETLKSLDRIFGQAVWTFINTMKSVEKQTGKQMTTSPGGKMDVSDTDLSKIYSLQPMLAKMPPSIVEDARKQAEKNPDTILLQSGSVMNKAFYRELGVDTGAIQVGYIVNKGLWMLLVTLAAGAAAVLVGFLSAKLSAGVARNLRKDIFSKVESYSNGEFDRYSTASLITRTTNDVTQIQMLLMMGVRMICYAPILGIGGIIMALHKSVSMSWIIALACAVLVGLILVVFAIAIPRFKVMQKLIDRLNLVARENLNGLMVIRAFGTQNFEENRFDKANEDLTDNSRFVFRIIVFMMPAMMLIMNLTTLLIVWVGAHQIASSALQVGDMMAFMQYAMQIIMSFLMIAFMFIMVPRASVSGARIAEVLEVEPAIVTLKSRKNSRRIKPDMWSSEMSVSATAAPTKTCCRISPLPPNRGRLPRLSVPPVRVNPR
jgi:ATP-binding cassette subfamily B protein